MSKLLIPNTTQVPNILLDEVIPKLPPGALRVLLVIVRFTYGFGKSSDRISLKQLEGVTGLSRWGVVQGIKALETLINIRPGAKGRGANEYSLNLDIVTGQLVNKVDQSDNLTSQVGSQISRPSQTYSKPISLRERVRKASAPINSVPGVKQFLSWWDAEYRKRVGEPYVFNGGKEGKLIKERLRQFDLPKLKTLALRFLDSKDPWVQEHGGYTIGVFASQINKLISTSKGTQRQPMSKEKPSADLSYD